MSSCEDDVVSTTTGTCASWGSDLICSRTWRPSNLGRLRSSTIRSTAGAPAWSPRWYRKSSASSPSRATCSRLPILWSSSASRVSSSSPASSSTSRISTGCKGKVTLGSLRLELISAARQPDDRQEELVDLPDGRDELVHIDGLGHV